MNKTDSSEHFNLSRISFAVLGGKCVHTMFDKRTHKEWLKQSYGIVGKEFEKTIRGYLKDGNAYFYKSSNFEPIDLKDIGIDALTHLHILSMVYMNTSKVTCYNGLIPSDDSTEWEPVKTIGDLKQLIDQRSACCREMYD